ncbi:MAG: hypothetical protein J3K34DRAFT_428890 [Monoraphidium minutum]|nr:MAG: hypothetical protein J3K34DRAFT_428890 [Monoraphidium minutum]
MGGKTFVGPGVGFGLGAGCGFGVGWGFGGGGIGVAGLGVGGGCGVGVGLGWGFGAAWGSSYRINDPEFGDATAAPSKPRWFSQLQQQLRIAKFEASHAHDSR